MRICLQVQKIKEKLAVLLDCNKQCDANGAMQAKISLLVVVGQN